MPKIQERLKPLSTVFAKLIGADRWKRLLGLDYGARLYACNLIGQVPSYEIRHRFYQKIGRIKVGPGSSILRGLRLFCLGGIEIGANSVINGECWLDGRSGITIGNNVSVSIGSRILTLGHDPQDPNFKTTGGPVVVEDYAWVGAFATILPGVRLGRGCVVGAGAVVTKNVAPGAIVAGNPAKVLAQRTAELDYRLEYAPPFL